MLSQIRDALADKYVIERELGRGGMSIVFLAHELKHNRKVALKVLKPEIANTVGHERFLNEIGTTARLNHPNILPLFDSDEAAGFVVYTMPYVEGESLAERVQRIHRMPVDAVFSITRQIADALAYAHTAGIVHRDIKPDNIFIAADGHVWLADFGLARALSHASEKRLTGDGFALGSPYYMSPEQARAEPDVDSRSDVYSLACVVFELLAGEPPFRGNSIEAVLRRHLSDPAPSIRDKVPTVHPLIDAALRRAMAKDRSERFATIREFERALRMSHEAVAAVPDASVGDSMVEHPAKPRRTSRPAGKGASTFYAELKRRKVVRAAIAYGIVAIGAIQLADPVAEALTWPAWTLTAVVITAALGLPIVMLLAWLFEIRRDRKPQPSLAPSASPPAPEVARAPAATRVYRLDTPVTPLIGRESDLQTAMHLLQDASCRVLTVTGPGGIGKTSLAQEVAHRVSREYAHGACFVALAGVETMDTLPAALADALQLPLAGSQPPAKQLSAFLQEKNLILVLDNFEQIVDGAQLLSDVIARAPHVRAIVTSRRRLRIAGEHVLQLDALTVPANGNEIAESSAGALFLQVARRSDPRFTPDAEAVEAIARICHVTAGIPLAIELAAASVGLLSPSEIARTLEESHDVILGARRDLAPRHQSLQAAFESSWRLLDSEERRAFRRLAVFRGGFDREAAASVAGAELELLARLVEASLVRRPASGQFEILEVLRQFGEDKLIANQSEAADVRRRHSQYFLERLANLAALPEGPSCEQEIERLAYHIGDLRAAWLHATAEAAHNDLRRAAPGFFSLLQARGRSQEGADLFGRAAAAMRPLIAMKGSASTEATATLARLLPRQASFLTDLGEISEAGALAGEGLSLLRAEGDEREIALAVFKHCNIARASGEFTSPVFEEAVERYRALNDLPGVARALNALATAFQARGNYAEAKQLYQESVQIYRRIGLDGEAWAPLNNLSAIAEIEGDSATARKILEDELVHARRRNHPRALSFLLINLAHVCQSSGDLTAAEAYLAEGIQLCREMGYRTSLAYALNTLADIQFARAEIADASTAYREALLVAVQAEEGPLITSILVAIARLLIERKEELRAAEILRAVVAHPSTDEETRAAAVSLLSTPRANTSNTAVISLDEAVQVALYLDDRPVMV